MSVDTGLIYDIKRKMLAKYPRFGSEIAVANIEFRDDLPFHTAATDGKNIYVDPNYFESLSENDRLFTIAHEIIHKFNRLSKDINFIYLTILSKNVFNIRLMLTNAPGYWLREQI